MSDIRDLRAIAAAMDTKFRGPFGFRFGLDGLLGLIPLAGDVITGCISLYVIARAAQIGCPPSVLARMGLNLLIESAVDVIPVVGNLFDFVWKANSKNLQLVERHLQNPARTRRGSRAVLALTVLIIFAAVAGFVVLSFLVIRWIVVNWL